MPAPITGDVLAELHAALGNPYADQYRDGPLSPEEVWARDDVVNAVNAALDGIPEPGRGKHDEECWRRHVPCLAARVRGALP